MNTINTTLNIPDMSGNKIKLFIQGLGSDGVKAFYYGDKNSPNKGENGVIYKTKRAEFRQASDAPSEKLILAYEEAVEECLKRGGTFTFTKFKEIFFKNPNIKATKNVESELFNVIDWYAQQDSNYRLMYLGDSTNRMLTTQGQIQAELFLAENINDNRGMFLALTESDALNVIAEQEQHFQDNLNIHDFKLSEEQRNAVIRTLTSNRPCAVIAGAAGGGKSASMWAIAHAYLKQGWTVDGTALSWQAAHVLANDTNIKCSAIEGYLRNKEEIALRQDPFPNDTAIIFDEAGQLKIEFINRILALTKKSKNAVKLIFTGESAQLNPVGGCNALDLITAVIDKDQFAPITEIRRQKNPLHRDIVKLLRNNESQSAIEKLYSLEMLEIFNNETDLEKQLLADFMSHVATSMKECGNISKTPLVLTIKNTNVKQLNQLIRDELINQGILDVSQSIFVPIRVKNDKGEDTLDELNFCVGEKLVFTRNFRNLQKMADNGSATGFVANRTSGIVTNITGDDLMGYDITLTTDAGEIVQFNTKKHSKDFSLDVTYNYAITAYSSQGKTVDNVLFYADSAVDSRYAYVACSRHRQNLTVYVNRKEFDEKNSMQTPDILQAIAKQWHNTSSADSIVISGLQKSYELIKDYISERNLSNAHQINLSHVKGLVKNIPSHMQDYILAAQRKQISETITRTEKEWLSAYDLPENRTHNRVVVTANESDSLEQQVYAKLSVISPFVHASGLNIATFAKTAGSIFIEGKRGDLIAIARTPSGDLQSKYRIMNEGRSAIDLIGNNYPFFIIPKHKPQSMLAAANVIIFQNFNDLKNHLNKSDGESDDVLIWGDNHFISKSQENQDILKDVFGIKMKDSISFIPDSTLSDDVELERQFKKSWLEKIESSLNRANVRGKNNSEYIEFVNDLLSGIHEKNNEGNFLFTEENYTLEDAPELDNDFWEHCMHNEIPPSYSNDDNAYPYGDIPVFDDLEALQSETQQEHHESKPIREETNNAEDIPLSQQIKQIHDTNHTVSMEENKVTLNNPSIWVEGNDFPLNF